MNAKNVNKIPLAVFFFAAVQALAAQDGPVLHRLNWQPVEYASDYEVTVEILTASNEWAEQLRKTSGTETFIDCPLVVGKYRFSVSAFDLLGRPGSTTDWIYFELRAREPDRSESEVPPETGGETSPSAEAAQTPENVPPAADAPALPPPAPQEDETPPFALELFYTPLITLPFSDFNEIYSTNPFQPVGFTIRFAAHPFDNPAWGLGAAPFWNFLTTEIHSRSRYTHIAGGHLFAAWRIQPPRRDMYITIRAGGGMTYLSSRFDFNEGLDVVKQATWNPSVSIDVSIQSRLTGPLFLDAGIEYFHIFSRDNLLLNYLRPMLGIGWRF
ncbi:MAG: hypothetical protein LBL44_06860 [Treponema sp.]|jgi:hypothetical protein|nr:hypothetical protein [Treponema sp.]